MNKKIEYLTNCQSAIEHLRVDAKMGKLLIYPAMSIDDVGRALAQLSLASQVKPLNLSRNPAPSPT
jgi:hypothetical protein